jgi:hypothetical protein
MNLVDRISRFFGSKRRLIELEADIADALRKPTHEERRRAIGEILRKCDPERFAQIEGKDGYFVTDGKTVGFEAIARKSP